MELRHLKYFVTVAEERHFSRAAARLRVSQPAISRQIKDLEEELGVVLLTRDDHKVGITPAGEAFLAHARDLLKRAAKSVEEMKVFQNPGGEKLSVGFTAPSVASTLVPAIPQFEAKHPRVELELLELSPQTQIECLRSRRIDLGFIGSACEALRSEFQLSVIQEIPLAAVVPSTHRLASLKKIRLGQLSDESFIGFSEKTLPGRLDALCRFCQVAGFTPAIRHQAESLAAALALIGIGKGVSLMPEEASQLPHPGAVFLPLHQPTPMLSSTAAHRKEDVRQSVADLIMCCRQVASKSLISSISSR